MTHRHTRLAKWGQTTTLACAFTAAVFIIACESGGGGGETPAPTPAPATPTPTPPEPTAQATPTASGGGAKDEAHKIFEQRCVVCHGDSGKGDGPGAANLQPAPRDYTDPAWQTSVTDEEIEKIIVEGGAAVGKSPLMPPNPDLKDKPEVVAEIRNIIRSFGGE